MAERACPIHGAGCQHYGGHQAYEAVTRLAESHERAPTHLLVVKDGERLQDHKTACGLNGVSEVPAEDGLTQSWLSFTCRACAQAFARTAEPEEAHDA